jgi:transketolase
MRKVFGDTLGDLMAADKRIAVINADLAGPLGAKGLAQGYPERYFNVGVQEASMTSFAAGLATCGFIPVAITFCAFATRRVADQLAVSVGFGHNKIVMVGGDPGVGAEINGGTHMSFEDIGIIRSLAKFTIVEPADAASLAVLLPQAITTPDPVYLRLFRKERPDIYTAATAAKLQLGKSATVRAGTDVTIIASGIEVAEALKAAESLAQTGISAEVIDVHTVKPLDHDGLLASLRRTGRAVVAENASVMGGLGSAVAELTATQAPGVQLKLLGVNDQFGQVGKVPWLLDFYQLSAPHIDRAARELIG